MNLWNVVCGGENKRKKRRRKTVDQFSLLSKVTLSLFCLIQFVIYPCSKESVMFKGDIISKQQCLVLNSIVMLAKFPRILYRSKEV